MTVKIPPIPIIISMVLLSAGYFCNVYHAVGNIIFEARSEKIIDIIMLSFMTLFMIGTCTAVLTRHARSILLLGVLLLLSGFACRSSSDSADIAILIFFIMGILFVVWSIRLFRKRSNPSENTFIQPRKIYKYWRYSVIAFFVVAILLGILGSYFGDMSRNYESIQKTIFQIMSCFLAAGILQLVIYYILSRKRDSMENEINSTDNSSNLQD